MTVSKSRKRPPGSVLVQQAAIEQADDLLQKLPAKPKEHWSLREAIESLEGSIMQALDRGYTHEEVAELLEENGISISVSSLKRYLAASRKEKGIQPRRTRKPRGRAAAKAKASELTSVEPMPEETAVEAPPEPAPEEPAPTPSRRKRSASSTPKSTVAKEKTRSSSTSTRGKATGPTRSSNGRRKKTES